MFVCGLVVGGCLVYGLCGFYCLVGIGVGLVIVCVGGDVV